MQNDKFSGFHQPTQVDQKEKEWELSHNNPGIAH